jgi:hypothetical protein
MSSVNVVKARRSFWARCIVVAAIACGMVTVSAIPNVVSAGCRSKSHLSIYPDILSAAHAQFFDHGVVVFDFILNPNHASFGFADCGGDEGFIFEADPSGSACAPASGTYSTTVTYCDPHLSAFVDPQFQMRFEQDQTTPKKKSFGINFTSDSLYTYYNAHVGADGIYYVTKVEYQGVSVDVTNRLE